MILTPSGLDLCVNDLSGQIQFFLHLESRVPAISPDSTVRKISVDLQAFHKLTHGVTVGQVIAFYLMPHSTEKMFSHIFRTDGTASSNNQISIMDIRPDDMSQPIEPTYVMFDHLISEGVLAPPQMFPTMLLHESSKTVDHAGMFEVAIQPSTNKFSVTAYVLANMSGTEKKCSSERTSGGEIVEDAHNAAMPLHPVFSTKLNHEQFLLIAKLSKRAVESKVYLPQTSMTTVSRERMLASLNASGEMRNSTSSDGMTLMMPPSISSAAAAASGFGTFDMYTSQSGVSSPSSSSSSSTPPTQSAYPVFSFELVAKTHINVVFLTR